MSNIKEVAKKAKVSTATVSHVINKTRYVSEELTERVFNAMDELDYHPNKTARSLRLGKSNTIGLIVPDISNQFYGELCKEIENIGSNNDYSVILCNTDNNPEKEKKYIDVLIQENVDGIIFISCGEEINHFRKIRNNKIPLIIVDRIINDMNVDMILLDNHMGGILATNHLINLGHRKIAFISGSYQSLERSRRFSGYKQALKNAEIEFDEALVFHGNYQINSGIEIAKKIVDLNPMPTAIFASNDLMAIGAMNTLKDLGVKIPEEISIVGFDNILSASTTTPSLTTINQPKRKMAAKAIELLLYRIEYFHAKANESIESNDFQPYQEIIVEPEIIIRNSSAPLT